MLTIDGIPVEVEKGTTILTGCQRRPDVRFLHYVISEDLLPDGSCRLCVVGDQKYSGRKQDGYQPVPCQVC
ncbi:MAG: 2Fe-2S iron-sulfur cluster-binding protein [Blautia sp.]